MLASEIKIVDPNWIVGFTSGDGSFTISTYKSTAKLGESVKLSFLITQHNRDEALMSSLISIFGCGNIKKVSTRPSSCDFIVTNFTDIYEKIIPFFKKYEILGIKQQDFNDWCRAAELINNKAYLTTKGLEEIKKIKAGINSGRAEDKV